MTKRTDLGPGGSSGSRSWSRSVGDLLSGNLGGLALGSGLVSSDHNPDGIPQFP